MPPGLAPGGILPWRVTRPRSRLNAQPCLNVLVPALALIAALPVIAHAQAPEAWKVTVVPYLLGAGMSGTSAMKSQELTVEASASDIFSNLQ